MTRHAVSYTARFIRRYFPSRCHGGSRFCILLLAFTSLVRETVSKLTSFLTGCGKCTCAGATILLLVCAVYIINALATL